MKVIMFTAMDDPNVRQRVPRGRSLCLRVETGGAGDLLATIKRLCVDLG